MRLPSMSMDECVFCEFAVSISRGGLLAHRRMGVEEVGLVIAIISDDIFVLVRFDNLAGSISRHCAWGCFSGFWSWSRFCFRVSRLMIMRQLQVLIYRI